MNYEELVTDFATRTRANLKALQTLEQRGAEVYPVTQLINSLLGLLVFPQQRFYDRIPETPLDQLAAEGWPTPEVLSGGGAEPVANLRELVRYLRNAVAHCNLEAIPGERNEIVGFRVWNTKRGQKDWEARLCLADLEKITDKFIDLLTEPSNTSQSSFLDRTAP